MNTATAVAILIVLLGGGYVQMWKGWRRRGRGGADLPPLPDALPAASALTVPVDASYLGTTAAGDWLARVAAHSLSVRGRATVSASAAGVTVERGTEPTLSIPVRALRGARADRAGGGRAVRRAEYVIITWEHGDRLLDTAVRPRRRDDLPQLLQAVQSATDVSTYSVRGRDERETE